MRVLTTVLGDDMQPLRPEMLRGMVGAVCVAVFAIQAFTFSADADTNRNAPMIEAATQMPTARDLAVFERRVRKATRDDDFADSCERVPAMGGTEIHVAMNFPPIDRPATADAPGIARAHVEKVGGAPKALVLESKYPTLWSVTGSPSIIVLLGEAVVADFPEGTQVIAPRFAEGCGEAKWSHPPAGWAFPANQTVMSSLVDNLEGRFDNRAQRVAERLFSRPATSWTVRRGDTVMEF